MEITEEMHIAEGILKAIEWLKQMGRPILADKMDVSYCTQLTE